MGFAAAVDGTKLPHHISKLAGRKDIIVGMARGWESKSIEAQQDEAAAKTTSGKPRLTREAADRVREKEKLRLALENVSQQLKQARDARHRDLLEAARCDLQHKIEEMGFKG